ncbi:MAG: tyrosine-type recombinase/integrase [Lachnospiraceae bacterium]
MCYKDEVQKKNAQKLQRRFEEDNIPIFIRDYFYNLNSEAGKINYYSVIISMLKWMIKNKRVEADYLSEVTVQDINFLSKTDIIVYLENLITNGTSPSTINTKKNVLSSFWSHLVDEGVCDKNIIHSIPKSKFKIKKKNNAKVPLPEDMMEMIEKIKRKKDDFVRERNLIIIRVLKGTGLRESELAGLDLKDLYLKDNKPYIMVMGKGVYYTQDAEKVLVSKDAKLAFEEWLEIRSGVENIIDGQAVFINKNGRRLSEGNIQAVFRNYSGGKISPHMMRHLYATVLYQETGHDAAFVQEQLRHSDVNTTIGTYAAGDSRSYEVLENL